MDDADSLRRMQALLRDIENYSDAGEDFSVIDLVDSVPLQKDDKLLSDLVRHHYDLLKEKRPDLSVDEYESMFPQHAEWSQWLGTEFPEELLDADSPSELLNFEYSTTDLDAIDTEFAKFEARSAEGGVPEFLCGPLEDLSAEMQKVLRSLMKEVSFEPGQVIIEEGVDGDCLYVCSNGLATVSTLREGAEPLELGKIFPGHVFGEMALMGVTQRTASVIADEPFKALSLSKDDFLELCKDHEAFAHVITAIIADRLGRRSHDALSTVTLKGYKIHRRLGRGGMAIVYDAESIESGDRVALKMMSHRLAFDEDAKEWFKREADVISRFDHPNIPTLIEHFDAFSTSFIAMEYLEGVSLIDVIRQVGPLDEESVLRIIAQLSDALVYAHAQGIIHRDVKPSNGMVAPNGHVKLMDFGLAVPRFGGDDSGTAAFGTPAYIAPEQISGKICSEGDWFSLGLIGFELATGEKVFAPKSLTQMKRQFEGWDPKEANKRLPKGHKQLKKILKSLLSLDASKRTECLAELTHHCKSVEVSDWNCWES